jgi:glycosyltransferase involved in cell wall biosynthesis
MGAKKTADSEVLRILAVARWPLGGIRTYMRYTYKYLPKDRFKITIFASRTGEEEALREDAKEMGARLIVADPIKGKDRLFLKLFLFLLKEKFDIIQSHGFISAAHVYLANWFFRLPHILTIHGIIEEKFLGKGFKSALKRRFLEKVINNVDVLYGVSHDILENVVSSIKVRDDVRKIVIHNGIDVTKFIDPPSNPDQTSLRQTLGLSNSVFLLGFLGRFMAQKGFNFLIDAIRILEDRYKNHSIRVLAVGSGDYLEHYRSQISAKGLNHRFIFLPFQRDIAQVYKALDVVVMPSVWEAYPLQPAEALCLGIPIIASDCMGLREAVKDTPAIVVPSQNPDALAGAIYNIVVRSPKTIFGEFRGKAIEKYDVRVASERLRDLLQSLMF